MAEDKNETDKKDEQQAAAANVLPAELSKEMRTSFLEYSLLFRARFPMFATA